MAITDEFKKTITNPTPLYALAGAGDLAYEKLREVPGRVEAFTADPRAAQERAAARLQEAQSRLTGVQARVSETVSGLPADLRMLQEKAQGFALQQVGRAAEFAVRAREMYDELAQRGKIVVDRSRREAAKGIQERAATFEGRMGEAAARAATTADEAAARAAETAGQMAGAVAPERRPPSPAAEARAPKPSVARTTAAKERAARKAPNGKPDTAR